MKAWQEISLQLQRQNAALGQTVNVVVTQDSYVSEFIIGVEGVIGTAAATAVVTGLPAILNKVSINGPLTGYAPLTPINNLSGDMLSEVAQFIRTNVSYSYGSLGTTGKFGVYVPCTFYHPRLSGAWHYMSCLPANLMGAVNFNIQLATQAQLDTNATPTLVFSSLSIYVQQNEYKSSSIPAMSPLVPAAQVPNGSFQFIPTSLNYLSQQNVQASAQFQQLFPNGTMMLILVRSFPTTTGGTPTSRQDVGAATGPLDTSITSTGMILQDVNQSPKSAVTFQTLRKDNLDHITDNLVQGNGCFQFNNGVSRIFQPIPGPNQIPLNYATTLASTTNPRIDFVYMQLFDTMNWLGLL